VPVQLEDTVEITFNRVEIIDPTILKGVDPKCLKN
jgi:hypothetical protein